ncbi:tRNA dimethylallyltransferase [Tasmannia lanceolata]|uniref:tRNA dimethylallyltransferase n=1 Tax=Tasmannia lanceolata TaxID=3420 RepID=UPI004063572C
MVERFFSTKQMELQDSNKSNHIMLLSGPPSCGKTSLLFQFAFNSAVLNNSGNVVFICNKRRLETKPPFLSQGIDPASEVFQRIQMKYLEDDEGIKKYFAAFHLHKTFPIAVVVDDFGEYFNDRNCQERYGNARGRDIAMVRTLALFRDAVTHANERLKSGGACKLLLSDTHLGDSPRLLFIYKRWIPCIFTVKGEGSASYLLESSSSASSGSKKRVAKYSIALQYLVLEELIEEFDS